LSAKNGKSQRLLQALTEWQYVLRVENKAPSTIYVYTSAVEGLIRHGGEPRAYLQHLLETRSPATAHNRYRALKTFFNWYEDEGYGESPMRRMKPPVVPEKLIPIVTKIDLSRLCERDRAILVLLSDTGLRLGEIAGLNGADINLEDGTILVTGKGRRQRRVPLSSRAGVALARYLRLRPSDDNKLWVGQKGPMTASGIYQMVKKRTGHHPHQFRHTFAHLWLKDGGGNRPHAPRRMAITPDGRTLRWPLPPRNGR